MITTNPISSTSSYDSYDSTNDDFDAEEAIKALEPAWGLNEENSTEKAMIMLESIDKNMSSALSTHYTPVMVVQYIKEHLIEEGLPKEQYEVFYFFFNRIEQIALEEANKQ